MAEALHISIAAVAGVVGWEAGKWLGRMWPRARRPRSQFDVYRWLAEMERAAGIDPRASLWQAMYPKDEAPHG